MVVPLLLVGGHRLGVVAVERGDASRAMRRWEVEMVGQFAAHAALALYNGWLTEEREAQLETIRGLEQRLRAHNAELEVKVAERTEELQKVIRDLEEIDEQRRGSCTTWFVRLRTSDAASPTMSTTTRCRSWSALKMRLEMLATAHPELDGIMEAHKTVASTMKSMRRMLFDLSPPILDETGDRRPRSGTSWSTRPGRLAGPSRKSSDLSRRRRLA